MHVFLYNVIIFPLVKILDLCYLFFFRIFGNHGVSVVGVSFIVSLFTLPLYFEAEKWQQLERNIRGKLAEKSKKIKEVFHGDEQYMILSVFYRQNNYHPVFSLRSSIGLFLQIPFFIAAFSYLSNLDTLSGTPFWGINNLGSPDGLLKMTLMGKIWNINILPVLMTAINLFSSIIYLHGIKKDEHFNNYGLLRENIQFFGMALIFLILLYNSPSALVLYWTCNNLFSLFKNILNSVKHSKLVMYLAGCLCSVLLAVYLLFFHHGALYKRLIIMIFCFSVFFIPIIIRHLKNLVKNIDIIIHKNINAIREPRTIIYSSLILFLLTGFYLVSQLISTSVNEFSFIEQYTSPMPYIYTTAAQAFGFFVFWTLCFYFLVSGKKKYYITAIITIVAVCSLINAFIFFGKYGIITIELVFENGRSILIPSMSLFLINTFVLIMVSVLTFIFLCCGKKYIIQSLQMVIIISLLCAGVVNIIKISKSFNIIASNKNVKNENVSKSDFSCDTTEVYQPIYKFSKTGKNILVIMLDRGMPFYVPQIFIEKPQLANQFSGFVFYPNTISFGSHTLYGAPPIFGGYEYSPLEINSRPHETLEAKINQAYLLMPLIFHENGYDVTVTDLPVYRNTMYNLLREYPDIKAANIINKYTDKWLKMNPEIRLASISENLHKKLLFFSFMKCAPLLFRHYIYDDGLWLTSRHGNTPLSTIQNYAMLDILSEITVFSEDIGNTLTLMVNNLTHEPAFLQAPDYTIPETSSTNKGNGPLALDQYFHVHASAFLLLGKWFSFLKENDVYNNTRIIIVSDHGINNYAPFSDNIILPNGECLQFYSALLLFKDFNNNNDIFTDTMFMVNADTPILAAAGLNIDTINPFNGKIIEANKQNGVTITTSQNFNKKQDTYSFNIDSDEWLHVKDSIYDKDNWKKVRVN